MTGFDYFVLIVTVFSTVSGAAKGLVRSLFSLGAFLLGLILAIVFYDNVAALLKAIGVSAELAPLIGFILPILVTVGVGAYASYRIRKTLRKTGLSSLDTMGGAALGLVRSWVFCSSVYLALTAFPVKLHLVDRAVTGPVLALGAQVLSLISSKDLAGQFQHGLQELRRLKTNVTQPPTPLSPTTGTKKKSGN